MFLSENATIVDFVLFCGVFNYKYLSFDLKFNCQGDIYFYYYNNCLDSVHRWTWLFFVTIAGKIMCTVDGLLNRIVDWWSKPFRPCAPERKRKHNTREMWWSSIARNMCFARDWGTAAKWELFRVHSRDWDWRSIRLEIHPGI